MGDEKKQNNNWVQALEILSQVSSWIVVPIVLALIFGKMLDKRYETEPVIFLVLAGLGFIITCFGIIRIVKNYTKKLKETEKK